MRVSRVLITNSLCGAIGFLIAVNIRIIWPYRYMLRHLWGDFWQCVTDAALR